MTKQYYITLDIRLFENRRPKMFELTLSHWLGQYVCKLVSCGDMLNRDKASFNLLSYRMVSDAYVFGSFMMNRVVREVNRSLVVFKDSCWCVECV